MSDTNESSAPSNLRASAGTGAPSGAPTLFRSTAVAKLDVAAEIDNQLPLVPRRTWLIAVGAILLVIAFAMWAAITPSVTSVSASGRAVGSGISTVPAPKSGQLLDNLPPAGTMVEADKPLGRIQLDDGSTVTIAPMISGTVWQVMSSMGEQVDQGRPVLELLPTDSDHGVILMLPEEKAAGVKPGQTVHLMGGVVGDGVVSAVRAPIPPAAAALQVGLNFTTGDLQIPVLVEMPMTIQPGAEVSATIVLSDKTVLTQLIG